MELSCGGETDWGASMTGWETLRTPRGVEIQHHGRTITVIDSVARNAWARAERLEGIPLSILEQAIALWHAGKMRRKGLAAA